MNELICIKPAECRSVNHGVQCQYAVNRKAEPVTPSAGSTGCIADDPSVVAEEARKEYLRRNLTLAKSVGVQAGLLAAIERLECQKSPPKWLLDILCREYDKMNDVCSELAKHRNEEYDRACHDIPSF